MSAKDVQEPEVDETDAAEAPEAEAPPERLNLEVKIESPSACERHVTVTVAREDVHFRLPREVA